MGSSPRIPVVDLSPFTTGGNQAARRQVAQELAAKTRINGCVGLAGHGIPADMLEQAFDASRRFFSLSYDDKMKAPHQDGTIPRRGYSGLGKEQGGASRDLNAIGPIKEEHAEPKDFKESFDLGSEKNTIDSNKWPPEETIPGFRQFAERFYWELHNLSITILDALAMSLDLTDDEAKQLRELHPGRDNMLRFMHYPSPDRKVLKDKNMTRLGAHRDWSTFTLLFQETNGGLEFHDHETDEFVPALPKKGVLYLNIGDMFHRYSNGYYPSALHRVVFLDHGESDNTLSRYSIPYFVVPSVDAIVAPPQSVATEATKLFDPVTFNSYSKRLFESAMA